VTVTGPRQSGKTTLVRSVFRGKPYVSLEARDMREYAATDPRAFLAHHSAGAIIDEIQRVPDLLSYLQGEADVDPRPGRFILTGSQNLLMHRAVSQSLAGRTALLTLHPLAWDEVGRFPKHPMQLLEALFTGGYPAIHDRRLPPGEWLADYVSTYLERDVRQLLAVSDLGSFSRFLRLLAGRSAGLINASSLGADAGVTHATARVWIGVLEASYLVLRLPAFHRNVGKRLVKTPKIHLLDSGLHCFLLGIRDPDQLRVHPLRGAVFESWVVSEVAKARTSRGRPLDLTYFRDQHGLEVDLVVETDDDVALVETKSGETIAGDFFSGLDRAGPIVARAAAPRRIRPLVVYGGQESQRRTAGQAVPWSQVPIAGWMRSRR
jgi:hypothetical protein